MPDLRLTSAHFKFTTMLRDDDESEPEYDCPTCGRSFGSYARLDDHMAEHEGLKRCKTCGETIHGPYHRCR